MTNLSSLFKFSAPLANASGPGELTVERIRDVISAAADGDLDVRIVGIADQGPLADLAWGVNRLLDITEAYCKESFAAVEHANQRKYYRKIAVTGLRGSFVTFAETVNNALELMAKRDQDFITFADDNIRATVADVTAAAGSLKDNADRMRHVSEAAAEQANIVSDGVGDMSENAQTVASAVEEMSAAIQEISTQVNRTAGLSQDAVVVAGDTREQIATLSEAADKIGSVVELIQDIASKTRMLAFNATIEAQRAGPAGKGFAVVAEEVKHLAAATARATADITHQVGAVHNASRGVSSAMDQITTTIGEVENAATVVASSIEEQSAVTREIAQNVGDVAEKTVQIRTAVELVESETQTANTAALEVTQSSEKLSQGATDLSERTDSFIAGLAG